MIEYRSKGGKLLPWPPTDTLHDPAAEICTCDDCELPRFEAWADKIHNEPSDMPWIFGLLAIIAIMVIAGFVSARWF